MTTNIEDFMKNATDEQRELLFSLVETAEKEQNIVDKINRIYGSIQNEVYSPDGIGVTVCADEDDARVLSIGPMQELRIVKEQMRTYLKKAVELEMGHLGIIKNTYEHYVGKPILNKT